MTAMVATLPTGKVVLKFSASTLKPTFSLLKKPVRDIWRARGSAAAAGVHEQSRLVFQLYDKLAFGRKEALAIDLDDTATVFLEEL